MKHEKKKKRSPTSIWARCPKIGVAGTAVRCDIVANWDSSLRGVMSFFGELKDLLRGPFDLIPLTNAAVYSLGFSVFGAPTWKCVVVGVVAFAATKLHYGRRMLSRVGVLIMIASIFVWAELTPEPHELAQRARAVGSEFFTAVAPFAPAAVLR